MLWGDTFTRNQNGSASDFPIHRLLRQAHGLMNSYLTAQELLPGTAQFSDVNACRM